MNTQDIVSAVTALFMVGMIWLRTRVHYSQGTRGTLRLQIDLAQSLIGR